MALIVFVRHKQKSGLKRGGLNHTLEVVLTSHSHSRPSESPSSNAPQFLWGKREPG